MDVNKLIVVNGVYGTADACIINGAIDQKLFSVIVYEEFGKAYFKTSLTQDEKQKIITYLETIGEITNKEKLK